MRSGLSLLFGCWKNATSSLTENIITSKLLTVAPSFSPQIPIRDTGETRKEKNDLSVVLGYGGPLRNRYMVERSDGVIAFGDGESKGTKNLIACAKKLGKPLWMMDISVQE